VLARSQCYPLEEAARKKQIELRKKMLDDDTD
jgi:hypothetical protein